MSEQEMQNALKLLGYSPDWLEFGFLDVAELESQIAYYHTGKDPNREHYRYSAFCRVLASRSALSDAEIAHYIQLAEQDEDTAMGRSAVMNLIEWHGLREEQFERMSAEAYFADSLSQKLILRRRLFTILSTGPLAEETFAACLTSQDTHVQRELVENWELTPEQLERLAVQGANRTIRNLATHRVSYGTKISRS
jgi:hypothetical protein